MNENWFYWINRVREDCGGRLTYEILQNEFLTLKLVFDEIYAYRRTELIKHNCNIL